MIKENSFINTIKEKEDLTNDQEWMFRRSFRAMTKDEKKRHDSSYVRQKNKLSFSDWFELIGENIDKGHKIHEENSRVVYLSKDLDETRRKLNDPEYRKYIGLEPLDDDEKLGIKMRFEKYTEFDYPVK